MESDSCSRLVSQLLRRDLQRGTTFLWAHTGQFRRVDPLRQEGNAIAYVTIFVAVLWQRTDPLSKEEEEEEEGTRDMFSVPLWK